MNAESRLVRIVRDVGLAEELAQDAFVAALTQWPREGVPRNPGAWLVAVAKRRAIDRIRRERVGKKHEELAAEEARLESGFIADPDDELRRRPAAPYVRRVPSRAINRRTRRAHLTPTGRSFDDGDRARFPRSRIDGRTAHRARETHARRSRRPVRSPRHRRSGAARRLRAPLGTYGLQASIAACHARARRQEDTDWQRIAALYHALAQLAPSPVVALNRAVAIGMAFGPAAGLELVDELQHEAALKNYHLLPSVRGDLLEKLGRLSEARSEFERASGHTQNLRDRTLLLTRAARGVRG